MEDATKNTAEVPLPPLVREKKGWLDALYDLFPHRSRDPFLHASSDLPEMERRAIARDIRMQVRLDYQSLLRLAAGIIVVPIFGSIWLMALGLFIPFGIRLVTDPGNPEYRKAFFYSILYALVSWPIILYWVRQHLRISKAMRILAARFGGSVGTNRYLEFLAWLDEHWPAASPFCELEPPPNVFSERRWDLQTSYRDCPLLVQVSRRSGSRDLTTLRNVSLYLSAPQGNLSAKPLPAEIGEKFNALGFDATPSPAGMFMTHYGLSTEALNPERISQLLNLAYRTMYERNQG